MPLFENPTNISGSALSPTDLNERQSVESSVTRQFASQVRPAMQRLLGFTDEPTTATPKDCVQAHTVIHRLRPPVKAHGGKYYLARQIVPILLGVRERINEYLEPCAFGASVFLAMPRSQREILGDINPDVVALWSVLSDERSASELAQRLSTITYCQSNFEAANQGAGETMLDRATSFLVRCRFSRGGLGKSFAWSERLRGGRPGDENAWETFRQSELPRIIARTKGVEVTNDPCWWTVWESRQKV